MGLFSNNPFSALKDSPLANKLKPVTPQLAPGGNPWAVRTGKTEMDFRDPRTLLAAGLVIPTGGASLVYENQRQRTIQEQRRRRRGRANEEANGVSNLARGYAATRGMGGGGAGAAFENAATQDVLSRYAAEQKQEEAAMNAQEQQNMMLLMRLVSSFYTGGAGGV